MRTMITSVVVAVLLGGFTGAAAQLPPEIMADRYLVRAERLMAEEDYEAALEMMDKIVALQKEHDLTLPEDFHFKYAQVALSAGSIKAAIDSVTQYLAATGRKGKFYREALELLDEAEQTLSNLSRITSEQTCDGKQRGASCWMEVANQQGCYAWKDYLARTNETVTWTGKCAGGLAQGMGTLTWVGERSDHLEETGLLHNGKERHGKWVLRRKYLNDPPGTVQEGSYLEGIRHGQWVRRYSSHGDKTETTSTYENGKLHGPWREVGTYCSSQGNYVEGQKDGDWIECRFHREEQGSYVKGLKQGLWEIQHYDEQPDGHGGTLIERGRDGISTEWYEAGKASGFWTYTETYHVPHMRDVYSCYYKSKIPFVDGKRHGESIERDRNCRCWIRVYDNGERGSRRKVSKKKCRRELD